MPRALRLATGSRVLEIHDVIVIGGGPIGLAGGWRAAQRGLDVVVVDAAEPAAAWRASAGMLAPACEADFGEDRLLQPSLESARRYPDFAAELQQLTGIDARLRDGGTLTVALDRDDAEELRRRHAYQQGLDLEVSWLGGSECRVLEPSLSPRVRGGIHAPGERHVDPRELVRSLRRALELDGGRLHRARVDGLLVGGDRVQGVCCEGRKLRARWVVLAAGAWSGLVDGVPAELRPPVRPVAGQVLRLHGDHGLTRIVRTLRCYLVPRTIGELVVGATMEERGFHPLVTAGGVLELLTAAFEVLPGVTELALTESTVGLRPGSPDNAPLLGATPYKGLVYACGHHRNGILLTPLTADAIAELVTEDRALIEVAAFTPERMRHAHADHA